MQKLMNIPPRYVGLATLCLLTLVYLVLFRYDLYGIDEGAARGLLLDWSVGSKTLSPVAVLGFPDMRALLFAPLNVHWIGSLTAVKVLTMYLTFATALMIYRWAEQNIDDETALFATGLWLIAPLTISQVDSLGAGNFLVLSAVTIYWIEKHFRATSQVISGYYFILLLLIAFAVSMHPAGLGIAAAVAWSWVRDNGGSPRKRNILFAGMTAMIFFVLVSRMGWPGVEVITNPLPALSNAVTGPIFEKPLVGFGLLATGLLILSIVAAISRKMDLLSFMLVLGIIFGLLAPDDSWGELVLTMILFEGIAALIALNSRLSSTNLAARRGLVALAVVLLSSIFMLMDKQRYYFIHEHRLNGSDELIEAMVKILPDESPSTLIASQWPGRTMLATRRGTLPLPPVKKGGDEDRETFLQRTHGISYMLFDHHDKDNAALVRQVARLSDRIKTVVVKPGGVIVKMPSPKNPDAKPTSHHHP